MGKFNYMKLVWAVLFVAFAFISCYATAASLNLLLPSWPKIIFWVVTIGFFLLASWGTKLIVDSFANANMMTHPGATLLGGVLIVLAFWLCFSFPTNTHTFFYRNVASNTVDGDIITTNKYLSHVELNQKSKVQVETKIAELNNNVELLLGQLEAEIMHETNPGFGKKSKDIFAKFAPMFGVASIEPLSYRGTTVVERKKLCKAYREKMYALKEARELALTKSIMLPSPGLVKEVRATEKALTQISEDINSEALSLYKPKDVSLINKGLGKAYSIVKNNKDNVNFDNEVDATRYTADKPVTKVSELLSVIDTWKDYFKGKYKGRGFIIWVLASLLVDLGAFLFFNLAFKKD